MTSPECTTDSDERGVTDWLGDTLAGDCTGVWPGQRRVSLTTFGLRPFGDRHLSGLLPSPRLILGQFVSVLVSTLTSARSAAVWCPSSCRRVLPNHALTLTYTVFALRPAAAAMPSFGATCFLQLTQ